MIGCRRTAVTKVAGGQLDTSVPKHSLNFQAPADRHTLSARNLHEAEVRLNGEPLKLQGDNHVPDLRGERVAAGRMNFRPATISLVAVPEPGYR